MSSRSLIVLGATGAVGSQVVDAALGSGAFDKVTTLARRALDARDDPRLTQRIVDVFDVAAYEPFVSAHDAAVCTLGVGQPTKVTKEELYRVDVECALGFANACKRQGVSHFSLMTSVDANPRSRVAYLKMKGELEEEVKRIGFPRTSFFRPSVLVTKDNRYGAGQGMLLAMMPAVKPLLFGGLRKYRGIKVEDLGRAIVRNAEREGAGVAVLEWDAFDSLLNPGP